MWNRRHVCVGHLPPRSFLADYLAILLVPYPATLDYLYSLHRFGVKLGLEAITDILGRLGNPQRQYPTLHIAGTNGKGSSAAMLSAMLQAGGYRVGLYTSPHLMDFRERIRIQNAHISEEQVCELTARLRAEAHPLGTLTFFEFSTAMAFQHFLDQEVEIAIIEVGLGGRYDATNVLAPLGVLITGIGFDHEAYLGNTLSAIAGEKAGIIHQSAPVVLGEMPGDAHRVFDEVAHQVGSPIYRYGQHFSLSEPRATTFTYQGIRESIPRLQTNLLGRHQMHNVVCALALLESATTERFPLSAEAIRFGLQHVRWRGRLEILQHDPMVIVDGAHNPAGARVLFDFLQSQLHDCPGRKLIVILGMMQDKNHREYLQIVLPLVDTLILTQPHMNRAATVEELKGVVPPDSVTLYSVPDSWEAYGQALQLANPSDLICVTGSLFLVGEILGHLSSLPLPVDIL